MWKYIGILFILIGVTLGAETAVPLEPIPKQFNNSKGCYITELNKMLKVGDSAHSMKECFTYVCGEKQMILKSCHQVETSPLCRVFQNKTLHYPACCPIIHCEAKPVLKHLKEFSIFGFDLINDEGQDKKKEVNVEDEKEENKKLLEIEEPLPGPPALPEPEPEPEIKEEPVESKDPQQDQQHFISDLRTLQVLGLDLLNKKLRQDTNHNKTIITNGNHSVPNVEKVTIQQTKPTQHGNIEKVPVIVNNDTIINGTGNQTNHQEFGQLKVLSILGQDILGRTPSNLLNHENSKVPIKPPSVVNNNGTENKTKGVDGLRQEDVLLLFKRLRY